MSISVFPLGRGLFGPVLDGSTIDVNSVFRGYTPLIPVRRAVWETPAHNAPFQHCAPVSPPAGPTTTTTSSESYWLWAQRQC
jgi:hypothetical protein